MYVFSCIKIHGTRYTIHDTRRVLKVKLWYASHAYLATPSPDFDVHPYPQNAYNTNPRHANCGLTVVIHIQHDYGIYQFRYQSKGG